MKTLPWSCECDLLKHVQHTAWEQASIILAGRRPREEDSELQASLDFIVRLSFRTTAKKQFAAELIVNDKIDSDKEEKK